MGFCIPLSFLSFAFGCLLYSMYTLGCLLCVFYIYYILYFFTIKKKHINDIQNISSLKTKK